MILGNITLTFKKLEDEEPPQYKYVLVARHDGNYFVIACFEEWGKEGWDDHGFCWSEYGSDQLYDNLDKWPTWAELPFEDTEDKV